MTDGALLRRWNGATKPKRGVDWMVLRQRSENEVGILSDSRPDFYDAKDSSDIRSAPGLLWEAASGGGCRDDRKAVLPGDRQHD